MQALARQRPVVFVDTVDLRFEDIQRDLPSNSPGRVSCSAEPDRRAARPLGLAVGLAYWLTAGGASANADRLEPLAAQVNSLPGAQRTGAESRSLDVADLQGAPIFALTVGPSAVKEPSILLQGVSVSARRTAALISVDGRPAEWMAVGETRDGVTLQQVRGSRIVVDTLLGSKDVALGEQSAPEALADPEPVGESPPPPDLNTARDRIPPGFRSPLPPASAPK